MKQFKSRKPNRLNGYNYTQTGHYYVTICTQNRQYIFGKIANNKMLLNNAGQMVDQTLKTLPKYYSNIIIDNYVVMPNHAHIIIQITNNENGYRNERIQDNGQTQRSVPTGNLSLSNIIQRFKMITTKHYIDGVKNNNWRPFNKRIWQRSFYDHIIHIEKSLDNIRAYIINNPSTWNNDEHNINNSVGDDLRAVPDQG